VSPARERRRALVLTATLLTVVGTLAYGPTAYLLATGAEPTGVATAVAFLGSGVLATSPFLVADCIGPAGRVDDGPTHLLTGRTVTGRRSVDLDNLASVRYRRAMWWRVPVPSHLIVRDTSRACLVVSVEDGDVLGWLGSAVNRSRDGSVIVSPRAATALRVPDHGRVTVRHDRGVFLRSTGVWFVAMLAYICVLAATT
jgi:hypothetical protein